MVFLYEQDTTIVLLHNSFLNSDNPITFPQGNQTLIQKKVRF